MKITSLLYHDVIENGETQTSGFNGVGPDSYKLELKNFQEHIKAAAPALTEQFEKFRQFMQQRELAGEKIKLITFDDGGLSFLTHIAPVLEAYKTRGVFFISTKYINTEGFLNKEQILDLYQRGHIIGSHSHTHPKIISKLSYVEILEEWKLSRSLLEEILQEKVTTASIPGGYYSEEVAKAAEEAGFKLLFTSEPTRHVGMLGSCFIIGRYSIKCDDKPDVAYKIINNDPVYTSRQYIYWNLKKVIKLTLGKKYLKIREKLLK